MPALIQTDHYATVEWLGTVPHRDDKPIVGHAADRLEFTFGGPVGEFHAGETRESCSRVKAQYPIGTIIRNTRQVCILCADELDAIAAELGLKALDPAWLGATVVLRGIPDLSHVPPSARLQSTGGLTLTVDMQNRPCQFPAMTIEAAAPGHGKRFKSVAEGRRGVTAWVERPGGLRVGDTLRLHVPDQRPWRGV